MKTLEDLAMDQVLREINSPRDKSEYIISKMRRTYGRRAAAEALKKAQDHMKMLYPEYRPLTVFKTDGSGTIKFRR